MQYLLLIYGDDDEWDSTTTTVRVRNDDTVVEDGPLKTRERLGAFCVIEADSLDEAIARAERIPAAQCGGVEIRPVRSDSEYRE
jgi:hypothetical protein